MKRRLRWFVGSLVIVFAVPLFGTIAFYFVEPTVGSLWEAFYFTIVTIFTVGYGDLYPTTATSQLVAAIVVIVGFTAVITTLQSIFNLVISLDLREELGLPVRRVRMKNHIIVCGYGNVGHRIVHKLRNKGDQFVIVERDQNRVSSLVENDVPVISGDATENDTLLRANINEAKAMVLTMHDPNNIMTVIAAKRLNPDLFIVCEVEDARNIEVLKKLGANEVVQCFEMGAQVMASRARRMALDPVCGTEVDPKITNLTMEHDGHTYYFDSKECMEAFTKSPARFAEMVGLTEVCRLP
jgi:voltage-gated potassium channel